MVIYSTVDEKQASPSYIVGSGPSLLFVTKRHVYVSNYIDQNEGSLLTDVSLKYNHIEIRDSC